MGVRLVQAATGKEIRTFNVRVFPKNHVEGILKIHFVSAMFSPDGRLLFTTTLASKNQEIDWGLTFQCFEVQTGQSRAHSVWMINLKALQQEQLKSISLVGDRMVIASAIAPDGQSLAAAGVANVKFWNLSKTQDLRTFGSYDVNAVTTVFSPDGKWLLAGRKDGGIRVWDVATRTTLADLPAHEMEVTALAFSPDGRTLASGSADTTVLLWDWVELRKQVTTAPSPKAAKVETLWKRLAANDGDQVRGALAALAATPGPTVAFLKEQLKPIPPPKTGHIEKLLADMDSKSFAMRQKAMTELEQLGDLAAEGLTKRLEGKVSLELQRRIEVLRDKIESAQVPEPLVQALRGVEVLERIGTPEARQLLEMLASGAGAHRLTVEAAESLGRLKKQSR